MSSLKSKIWVGALTLAMSPLGGAAQGTPDPGASAATGTQQRPEIRRDRDDRRWENRRHHRRIRRHFRRHRRHNLGRGMAMMLRNPALREQVGISAEQWARISERQQAFAKSRVRDRADLRLKQMDLQLLLATENPDRLALDKKLREISEIRLAAEKTAIEHRLSMRNALSSEQKEKMKQLFRNRAPMGRPGPGPAEMQPPAV